MERIHYSNDEMLTGDAIAKAVVDYAEALAKNETSGSIDVPVRHEDGSLGRANILLGPASQLVTETEDTDLEEVEDPELVAHLERLTAALGPSRPQSEPYTPEPTTHDDEL